MAGATRTGLRTVPWVVIPTLTAIVQFVRGVPADGIVFLAVASALLLELLGVVPPVPALGRPALLPTLAGAAAAGLVLVLTPRHGIPDGIVLAAIGIGVLPWAWGGTRPLGDGHRRDADPRALRRTAIAWAVVGIVTCLWELTSWLLELVLPGPEKDQHPAISDLLDPAIDQLWFRALFVAAWLALGLALLTRGRRT